MGLAVSCYKNIRLIETKIDEYEEYYSDEETDYFITNLNEDYPDRSKELVDNSCYGYSDEDSFRAGSYGNYNQWRDLLAKFAGYPPIEVERYGRIQTRYDEYVWQYIDEGDFYELINFSDCEGFLDTMTCKKLYNDFEQNKDRLETFKFEVNEDATWFKSKYQEWLELFKFASENGCVSFH